MPRPYITAPPEERFWFYVHPDPNSGCWLWGGAPNFRGYGVFTVTAQRSEMAHRYSWALAYGPIPRGLWCLHKCDTPACVNPQHLFLGTVQDNVTDMMGKGRGRYGRNAPQHKKRVAAPRSRPSQYRRCPPHPVQLRLF